jgi:hypothetical protein
MIDPATSVDAFILRWQGREGGQERANYALFLSELCDVLGVPRPQPASASTEENDYVFERLVPRFDCDQTSGSPPLDEHVLASQSSSCRAGPRTWKRLADLMVSSAMPMKVVCQAFGALA